MKETAFKFNIASDIDFFEDLIANIYFDTNLVAILTQENGFENLRIQIYPPENRETWDFRFDEFEEIIQKAKKRLGELRKLPDQSE